MSKSYGALHALGDALQGGGKYLGVYSLEKLRSERLAQARAEEVEDRQYSEGREDAKYARDRADKLVDEERGIKNDKIVRGEKSAEGIAEYETKKGIDQAFIEDEVDSKTYYSSDGTPSTFKIVNGEVQAPIEVLNGLYEDDPTKKRTGDKAPTEGQLKAAGFLYRMTEADKDIDRWTEEGAKLKLAAEEGEDGEGGDYLDMDSFLEQFKVNANINSIRDPATRKYASARADWVRAKLRHESGAVISDKEALEESRGYFPELIDDPEVIKYKAGLRARARHALTITSGSAWTDRPEAPADTSSTPTTSVADDPAYQDAFDKY